MSATTQFRLAVPVQDTRPRPPVVADEQIINLTLETEDKLLLTVVEAARRLGIGRTLMYELLDAGEVFSVHIGRLHKVPVEALREFIERRRVAGQGR